MKPELFEAELALIPKVLRTEDLPQSLQDAARRSIACQALVEERIRCDRLLEQVETIDPPEGFAEAIVRAALLEERSARRPLLRVLRSPATLAVAALLAVAVTIGLLMGPPFQEEPVQEEVSPEMLAQLDLLLDWDLLNEHGEELDLLASADLADILSDFDEDEGVPR